MDGENSPAYLRLRACIAAMILEGNYQDGDMLPSLRSFAHEHGANPLTVAKAYQSFQEEGLIVVKRGIGMFLAEGATERLFVNERQRFLEIYWPHISAMIERLGLDAEELLARSTGRRKTSIPA
jgi:GntR family transcriptional regulator